MTWVERRIVFGLVVLAVAGLVTMSASSRPAASPPAWAGEPRFSGEHGWSNVVLLATRFPQRWSGGPDRQAAADWIAAALREMRLDVRRKTFTAHLGGRRPVTLENVWGVSPGSEHPDEVIVVVGNYDMAPTSFQAASDTAGHAGTILELARVMSAEPHRRTMLFLFPDGEEWGMLGARHFARTFPQRDRIAAALSIEDLDVGAFVALGIDATGQFRGFAPMWLRGLAADAAAREGFPTDEVGPLLEWIQRSLLVSSTDQGPFLGAGVQAIDLAGRGNDVALKDLVYHLPADTIEKMRPASVVAYGRIQERILRGLDALPSVPSGPTYYLRTDAGQAVPALPLALRQLLVFVPLALTVLLRLRRLRPLRSEFVAESRRLAVVLAALLAWVGFLKALPLLGLMPRYALYPPPPQHPLLTDVQWVPVIVSAAVLVIIAFAAAAVLRRLRGRPEPADPVAARRQVGALLCWLLVVSLAGLVANPFGAVTFLLLPALLWIWIVPSHILGVRVASGVTVALGFLVVVRLFVQYGANLRLGAYILWYVYMAMVYSLFTVVQLALTFATLAIGLRLIAVAAIGRALDPAVQAPSSRRTASFS